MIPLMLMNILNTRLARSSGFIDDSDVRWIHLPFPATNPRAEFRSLTDHYPQIGRDTATDVGYPIYGYDEHSKLQPPDRGRRYDKAS